MTDASCQLPDVERPRGLRVAVRAGGWLAPRPLAGAVQVFGGRRAWGLAVLLLLLLPLASRAQETPQPASRSGGAPAGGAEAPVPAAPRGLLMDEVVATLEEALITRSDLVFEARVHALGLEGTAALSRSLGERELLGTLERSLAERLHAREAERLGVVPPTPQELEERLQQLEARAGGTGIVEAFLRVHGADRGQLTALLERGELAARARESRVRVRAQVTEAEVRRAWEASGSQVPFGEEREGIAARLQAERAREVEGRELERLLRNAKVRRIAPWARLTAGQGR